MLCISACSDQKEPTATAEPTTPPTSAPVVTVAPTAAPELIKQSEKSKISSSWSKIGSYGYDINEDGVEDNIHLYTSAKTASNGEIIWDDGQEWVLEVTDGINTYTLFDEYIQLGNVYFEVMDYYDADGKEVPTIVLVKSSSASFSVTKFTFDTKQNAFVKNDVINSDKESSGGINQRYSSFPTI